mmetsp:Transcript_25590/g.35330  ORF Transcript_25590/g.35330 Transcript_25590/m.35330 type:complete len:232 (-) Transcript_25590:449-1144(-)
MGARNPYLSTSFTAAGAVATPSATPSKFFALSSKMSAMVSPLPSLTPTVRLRDCPPLHVNIRSPIPASPLIVAGKPPSASATWLISRQARVTSMAVVLWPSPMPSTAPAISANTFFSAPPIKTPVTSEDKYTRRVGERNKSAALPARPASIQARTTPEGKACISSWAKVGPERKAAGCGRPSARGINSCMVSRVCVSSPFEVQIRGTCGEIRGANLLSSWKDPWTGTQWTT